MSRHFSPSVDHATNGNLVTANVSYWSEPASAKPGLQVPYHQAITGSGVDQFHLFSGKRNCQTTPSMSLTPNQNTPTARCNSLNNMNIPNISYSSDSTWNSYHSSPTQQLSEISGYSQQNSNFNPSWQNAKLLSPLQISPNASIVQNLAGRKSASSFTNGSNFNENNSSTCAAFSPIRRSYSNTMASTLCGQQKSFPISLENGTKNSDSGTEHVQIKSEIEDPKKYRTSLPSPSTSGVIDRRDIETARTILFTQSVEQQTTTVSTDDQDKIGITSSGNIESSGSGIGKSSSGEVESRDVKMEDESFDRQLLMDDESSRSTISTHDVNDQLQNPSNPEDQLPESFIDDKIQEFMNRRQPAVYTCKVCKYSCAQKFHFNSHMNTHTDRKCTMCDYTSRTEGRLKKHMNEAHLPLPSDSGRRSIAEDDVSEVFDPIGKSHQYSPPSPDGYLCDSEMADDSRCGSFLLANSNDMLQSSSVNHHPSSKPKRYKCKQCHYIAPSKDNFWEHQRSHIKPERLMSCSHCLFVTEYKHHMEYHLRNHSNVKPHKCPKCNYCCVNKSMLNSHLKSHSSVYQYRCRDCSYETKYCHSLKQHLRKHNHRPGKLVNQDGVEQEIQLDVYGNRRGPKVRRNNNNNDSNVHSEKTNCGSDKDSIFDQPPTVVVTRVSSKPTSARNSPNSAQQLISPLSLLDASNAASILASKSSSNIYQNLLLNRNGICSTTLTNGLASVPFLGSGGSMGVQLPTVPDLLTTAAATTTSSSSSSCVQTHNNSDVEKFKQMLAAQYLFLLKQQAMAAAAAAAAAAIDSSRSTPNVAAATTGDNTFLLNGGDAGLIFSSTGYALGGIGSFGFNKEQQDQEQRGRSRSFIGTLATSKSNYIKTNIGTEKKSSVINNGITPSTLMSSQLRLPRENTKFPSINADISSVTVSVADPLSVGTTSPRCRSRSPVCEALKASCSSDDGSGSNASNSHTNGGANFSLGNGSSRRKGKAFKLVDSIAMRLQSGNNSSSPVEDAESVNVNEVENIQENGSPSVAEYSDENICGNLNLEMRSADICSTDHQNDQQPKCDNHNNNDASILSHSHSSIIQQHNNQSSLATTTSSDAHMIVDGQQRDQSSVIDFSRSYHCSHCGIWFKCQIMYLLHKGCHSSDNPFKCNLCGATCDDSLKFFLHITQAPHDEL